MKNIFFTICVLTALAVIIIGCDKLKGDKGPTGPQGATGATGPQGASGSSYINLWEDFESGNFTTYPWGLTGNANWQIVSDYVMFGSKAAASGTISNSQFSSLAIQADFPVASLCSFYWSVDCEAGYDGLLWYVDGYLVDSRSGHSGGYYPATFAISPGNHKITWKYIKDASGSSGADKVWLDGILITDYKLGKQSESLSNPIPPGVVRLKGRL